MTTTYDSALASSLHRVRFLIDDTATTFEFEDEELNWILTQQANVYLAAARALSVLRTRLGSKGKGVSEKQVSKLTVKYGFGADGLAAIDAQIAELRSLGEPSPRIFEAMP